MPYCNRVDRGSKFASPGNRADFHRVFVRVTSEKVFRDGR